MELKLVLGKVLELVLKLDQEETLHEVTGLCKLIMIIMVGWELALKLLLKWKEELEPVVEP